MIKGTIESSISRAVLKRLHQFIGKPFLLDESICVPLDLSHKLVARAMRDLRSDNHLSYSCYYGKNGEVLYLVEWAEAISDRKPKKTIDPDQLLFNF